MKKIISTFLGIAMLFSICFSSVAFAEDTATVVTGMTAPNDTIAWSYNTATKTITFSIAEGKTGTTWSGIGNAGVSGYKDYISEIEKVVVSEGITRVGGGAFAYNATALKEVTLPSTLTEIASNAFNSCGKLDTLNFQPAGECTIGDYAFNATKFVNLVIPEGVTSIGQYAFNNLQGTLRSVVLPNTLTTIGSKAFRNAGNLGSITIPSEVTAIEADSFESAGYSIGYNTVFYVVKGSAAETFAKNINATNANYKYTYSLVDGCGVAGNIGWTLLDNVLTISGTGAVPAYDVNTAPWAAKQDEIRTVIIGEGITAIGTSSFKGAANVKTVQLPSTLTSIGANAFADSVKLMAVVIPDSVTQIGEDAFAEGTELCISTNSAFKDTAGYAVKVDGNSYTGATLAASGATINYGIYKNGDVHTLIIGGSGNMIGDCLSTNAPWYAAYGGKITKVVVDYGVTRVAGRLFSGNTVITDVTLADSVTGMQNEVFYNCSSITKLNNSNRLTSVGTRAYYGIKVTEIEIPATITSIGTDGFSALYVTSLVFPEGMTAIPSESFRYLAYLKEIKIPASVTTIGANAFRNAARLEKVYIPANCTTIADDAFFNAGYQLTTKTTFYCAEGSAAETYAINNSFNYVSYTASGVEGNLEWKIYNGVLSFEGAGTIPNYTQDTPAPWAEYADKVTDISLANTVTGIGANAFAGLTKLTKVNIPATVTELGENVFDGCTNLVILAELGSVAAEYATANSIELIIGGKVSDTIEWGIKDGVLTVTGTGEITSTPPWYGKDIYVNHVHTVVIGEGITKISGRAFERGVAVETVLFPSKTDR